MIQYVINALPTSFQLSGSILLLLWYLRSADKKIKKMSISDGELSWFGFGDSVPVSKDQLQSKATIFYKNVAAFIDIVIGYALAVLICDDADLCRCCLLLAVGAVTLIIILAENLLVRVIAIKIYNSDANVNVKDMV